jgi:ankyrin repeat protein
MEKKGFNHETSPEGAVWAAAEANNIRALKEALQRGCSTEEVRSSGIHSDKTALGVAASLGHLEAVKTLIDSGANVARCTEVSLDSRDMVTRLMQQFTRLCYPPKKDTALYISPPLVDTRQL